MTAYAGNEEWGIRVPVLTPVTPDFAPDGERFCAHIEECLAQGAHGAVLFGTTGEAPSFSVKERKRILEQVVKAGIPGQKLMIGNGCCALTETIDLTRHALALGVATTLMLPPFYFKDLTEEGLYRAYAAVIDAVADPNLRIFLYHYPKLSTAPISHSVIRRLIDQYGDIIAGVKDSTGDEVSTFGFIEKFPGLAILPGTERFLNAALLMGAKGCITASANVNVWALRAFWDAYQAKAPEAELLQAHLTEVRLALETAPSIPGLKAILAARHGDPNWSRTRPPLVDLAEEETSNLLKKLKEAGFEPGGAATE